MLIRAEGALGPAPDWAVGGDEMPISDSKAQETRKVFEGNFGPNLVGLIVYGSAAGSDFDPSRSDINVLAVMDRLEPSHESFSRLSFRAWLDENRVSPLYLTTEEVRKSQDVYPMEYLDMQKRRKVLAGKDFLSGLVIEPAHLRHQIEYELRGSLLSLRELMTRGGRSTDLETGLSKAFNSSCMLLKGLLRLEQQDVPETAAETIRAGCGHLKLPSAPLEGVLALRHMAIPPGDAQRRRAVEDLYTWLEGFLKFVDAYWENPSTRR